MTAATTDRYAMNLLAPRIHAIIDYVTIVAFGVAPAVLGLDGLAAGLSYVLATAHLVLTLATSPPVGYANLIPFRVHGIVELLVGGALLVLPWVLASRMDGGEQAFFLGAGVVILAVWAATHYVTPDRSPTATA